MTEFENDIVRAAAIITVQTLIKQARAQGLNDTANWLQVYLERALERTAAK